MKHVLIFLVSSLAFAQPSAEEIADRCVAALGGAEKLVAVKSLRMKGTYVYNGIEHQMVISRMGNMIRFDIEGLSRYGTSLEDGVAVVRCYDGKVAWGLGESRDTRGAYAMPAERAEVIAHRADIHGPLVDHAAKGNQLILAGAADVDGTQTWQLGVTLANGKQQTWFIDQKTNLPVKMSIAPGGEDRFKPTSWFFDDWREVGGIKIPHAIYMEEWLFAREHLIESVEINPKLDASLFQKPAS